MHSPYIFIFLKTHFILFSFPDQTHTHTSVKARPSLSLCWPHLQLIGSLVPPYINCSLTQSLFLLLGWNVGNVWVCERERLCFMTLFSCGFILFVFVLKFLWKCQLTEEVSTVSQKECFSPTSTWGQWFRDDDVESLENVCLREPTDNLKHSYIQVLFLPPDLQHNSTTA